MSSAVETPAAPATEAPKAPAPTPSTAIAPAPKREAIITKFDPKDPIALYMDTGIFEQLQRVAVLMTNSGLVPAHLRSEIAVGAKPAINRTSDCFLVAAQAFRWGMDPFSVAQHTFVLSGKLGYEGKLIAALVNASGRIQGNLQYSYSGSGDERRITVTGRLKGETQDRTVEGTVGGWKTQNEMWKKDPDQIGAYRGSREWARRHMPEVMLGITADEELVEREPLQRVDGGTRVVPALDVLTDRIAETRAVERAGKCDGNHAAIHPCGDKECWHGEGNGAPPLESYKPAVAPEPEKAAAPAETCEAGTKIAGEGERCDHGILLTDSCPKCILATKASTTAPAQGRIPTAEDDPTTPQGNPFLRGAAKARGK